MPLGSPEAKKRPCVLHALTFVQPPKEPDPPTVGGHDPRLSPSGQGVPPKAALTRLFLLWTLGLTVARLSGRRNLPFRRSATLRVHASPQRIHQIDDFCWRTLFRRFDLLTSLLLLQQLFERIFVLIFELVRLEVARFGFHDVRGQLQHVLWNFFVRDILEIFVLFTHLIRISQRNPQKALTA